ncbi:MAG: hypothetical protein IT372_22865 [Polyangiaceae bacterium]|nr:hypothetical protein [Polyangiaceae bacterium]
MNWQARQAMVALRLAVVALVACNTPPPDADATPAAPSAASPPAAAPRAGPAKINGKVVTEADMNDLSVALKNAGWTDKGSRATTSTTVVVYAEKDGRTAKVTLIKHLNGEAILAAEIDGKPDGTQELLDSLRDK